MSGSMIAAISTPPMRGDLSDRSCQATTAVVETATAAFSSSVCRPHSIFPGDQGAQPEQRGEVEDGGPEDNAAPQIVLAARQRRQGRCDLWRVRPERGHQAEQAFRQAEMGSDLVQPMRQHHTRDGAQDQAAQEESDGGVVRHTARPYTLFLRARADQPPVHRVGGGEAAQYGNLHGEPEFEVPRRGLMAKHWNTAPNA